MLRNSLCCLLSLVLFNALAISPALAQQWQLLRSPGTCTYAYERVKARTETTCSASAVLIDQNTSDIVRCDAVISGTQQTFPSVAENAPETINCWRIGRVFSNDGNYAIAGVDDDFSDENTRVRRRGSFVWSNAYWVYARSGKFDIRLCAGIKNIANPELGKRCSQNIKWLGK